MDQNLRTAEGGNSATTQPQTPKAIRTLRFLNPGPNISDFNPENSKRERRKLQSKVKTAERQCQQANQHVYDEAGRLISVGIDLCDCLDEDCPGCFYSCSQCSSSKCGLQCRVHRKWLYDRIDVEGGNTLHNCAANG
ncbi:ARL14 effector protein-like [Lethenteron reissneri]|uniref:ARL14 effector protein-like n=1 Tax=Lethenteron reissneri TaxID=7753 RepID=UPI002AB7ADBC|nr:ARL14 effector protein-like [Lethenteron reissneri]